MTNTTCNIKEFNQFAFAFEPMTHCSHSPKFDKITNEENMKNEILNKALKTNCSISKIPS